ncbi:MAG: DNA repair protein RecO [Bacteroidales bacterium]
MQNALPIRQNILSRALMLNHVRYGENGVVCKLYVREAGLKSFMVKGLGSKRSIIRPAYLQPLTLLEVVFEDLSHRELLHLKEAKIYQATPSLHTQLIKTALTFFMAEVIQRSIREMETNKEMYDFLESAVLQLENCQNSVSTYPHWFLLRLSRYLGFHPLNNQDAQRPWFHLEAGTFTDLPPGESSLILQDETSADFAEMLNIFTSDVFQPTPLRNRKTLLEVLLFYFSVHLPEFRDLKSPSVFQEIFHS